jgi:hypothetical protein
MDYYILNKKKEVVKTDMDTAAGFFSNPKNKRVAHYKKGDVEISTVFLSFDHNWSYHGAPILFETMVFGGKCDQWTWRYFTYAQALKGHAKVRTMVFSK